MANPGTDAPPIIIKKKIVAGGHHGGAWKVAYADFVTAMMALFIVLWLMNSSERVQQAVGGYFRDPSGKRGEAGSGQSGLGEGIAVGLDDMKKLQDKLETALKQVPETNKLRDQIEMTVTGEGLRVELLESDVGTFFESGSSQPTAPGKELLATLAIELAKLENSITAEGHTDAKPFTQGSYGNWELSADRANAARRLLESAGVSAAKIKAVRGLAATRLRKPAAPADASNRRISIIIGWVNGPGNEAAATAKQATASSSGSTAKHH
jgi:chemotaxis protein MotB